MEVTKKDIQVCKLAFCLMECIGVDSWNVAIKVITTLAIENEFILFSLPIENDVEIFIQWCEDLNCQSFTSAQFAIDLLTNIINENG